MTPPSKAQLDYVRHLLKQQGQPEPPELESMSGTDVSALIDGLKKKRGRPVWYGNGQFSHWEKRAAMSPQWSAEMQDRLRTTLFADDETPPPMEYRVAARHMEAKPPPHQRGWEHRKEQDERAQNNIPPEYQLAWKRLKNQFKGTPDQRAEQFMEYMEEHPGENDDLLQQRADKDVAKMQRDQQKQVKQERECEKNQTKYEDAWYKEQERATKEKSLLKKLKEKADDVCQSCPTCNVPKDDSYDRVPFAAAQRVAARYKSKKKIETR
jgi:hypothetical protein